MCVCAHMMYVCIYIYTLTTGAGAIVLFLGGSL